MLGTAAPTLRALRAALAQRGFASASESPGYVIFGASGGIGSALAARLLQHPGASVLLCGRDEGKLQALAERIGGGTPCVADVSDLKATEEAIARAEKEFGNVVGVANCVGSLILKSAHATSPKEFEEAWRTNALTAFHATRAAVTPMKRAGGGSIVLFSSAVARHGIPNHEAIASAKGAVYGLALSAAATYAPSNIRVNCVAPGMGALVRNGAILQTDTPLASKITSSEAALKASAAMHPLKRIGSPDEPAAVAEMLLHPGNSNITGQFIGVDGGLSSVKSQNK